MAKLLCREEMDIIRNEVSNICDQGNWNGWLHHVSLTVFAAKKESKPCLQLEFAEVEGWSGIVLLIHVSFADS